MGEVCAVWLQKSTHRSLRDDETFAHKHMPVHHKYKTAHTNTKYPRDNMHIDSNVNALIQKKRVYKGTPSRTLVPVFLHSECSARK